MAEKQESLLPHNDVPIKRTHVGRNPWALLIGALGGAALFQTTQWPSKSCSKGTLKHQDPVDWQPCEGHDGFLCGFLDVPKDYSNKSAGTASIAMSKLPANVSGADRRGTIFLNPGGPGGSGYEFSFRFSQGFSQLLNGEYDLIGFDPRGIGRTTPRVECFPSGFEYTIFKAGSIMEMDFDIPPDPFSKEGQLRLTQQHRELLAMQEAQAAICYEAMGDELKFFGTTNVVRDIEEMSRVIEGESSPINFAGYSYGTVMGAYLANMLPPHKIGKIMIDGVAEAEFWANNYSFRYLSQEWAASTEDTWRWFLRDCHESGASRCALALEGDTGPAQIDQRLMKYLEELYDAPVAAPGAKRPGIVTSGLARTQFYLSTNGPKRWPAYAEAFAQAVYHNNPEPLRDLSIGDKFNLNQNYTYPSPTGQSDLSRAAVGCADSPFLKKEDWPSAENMTELTLNVLRNQSERFGGSIAVAEPDGGCQFWPSMEGYRPKRFTGPWNNSLTYPMLIISNTADPITPLLAGQRLKASMGNASRLLIQDSPGHCSSGSPSVCRLKATKAFWLDDELPEDGMICPIDSTSFFPPKNASLHDQIHFLSVEDKELFLLASRIADSWTEWIMSGVL